MTSGTQNSEFDLLVGIKNGDHKCFESLFEMYSQSVYIVAFKYSYDEFEAEEIVQETFLKIWKYRESINEELSFKPFLVRIAKGLIYNKFKKQLSESTYINYYSQLHQNSNNTEESILFSDLRKIAEEGIENLPQRRKLIFELSRKSGLTNKEIAHKLNLSEKTVENQISSALHYLRHFFQSKDYSLFFLLVILFD